MTVPELDEAAQLRLLQCQFPSWCVSCHGGAWTATGRHPADSGLSLIADSAPELAMSMMWVEMQAALRRAATP